MHEERWVNRFLFAWNNSLFYDPLDTCYQPRGDHFLAKLDEAQRNRFFRSGIWWMYRQNPDLPAQGWKIHISADQHDVQDVVDLSLAYLLGQRVDFKLALDLNIFEMLNLKNMARGGSGKLFTIYPNDDDQFRQCLAELAEVLAGRSGAYVLSDARYRDSKALYFRYGQFLDTHSTDVMGRKVPYILDPAGERISDQRRPVFAKPAWAQWPFPDWSLPEQSPSVGLLDGRFRVVEAIQFSNTGGVYKAEDTEDGDRIVILKEARPGTNPNPRAGYDAVDVLKREWEFLNRLSDVGLFPKPISFFQQWEHSFIVEEFFDGTDIRTLMFEHSPLVRLSFDTKHSQAYLRVFLKIFRGLATAVSAAHRRNIVLGDFSAPNLLVRPDTFEVAVLDLEAARLIEPGLLDQHLQVPVELFTPGYSRSRGPGYVNGTSDDLFGVAATMAYLIFPIMAMSFLRADVLDVYRDFIDDLGWPIEIHDLIAGLAAGTATLDSAIALASDPDPLVEQVRPRRRAPVEESALRLSAIEDGLAAFVIESADLGRASLFPVDPFGHITNPLSLGFGASGVLYALSACGRQLRPEWEQWLQDQLGALDVQEYPAGLMAGLAGLAWATDGVGLGAESEELMAQANQLAPATNDYTFYYGLAGIGMANLHFYISRNSSSYLDAAELCAKELCAQAQQDGSQLYWLNDFAKDGPLSGLGYGQAGVAMFLLRMYQLTKDELYLRTGEKALGWEIAHAVEWDGDSISFLDGATLLPYLEVGGAGVAKVLLRYGHFETAERVLRGLRVNYVVMPGYLFGLAGIIDTMLDAEALLGDPSFRTTALQQFDYLRRTFLFEPSRDPDAAVDHRQPRRLAIPGEALFRSACDYGTGCAGLLRVVHRLHAGGSADFLLDQLDR
jgi:hypothetical protein